MADERDCGWRNENIADLRFAIADFEIAELWVRHGESNRGKSSTSSSIGNRKLAIGNSELKDLSN